MKCTIRISEAQAAPQKKNKKGLLVATSINHHFGPVIVLRREFVKYLPKIGTQRICWQLHAKIPFNLP